MNYLKYTQYVYLFIGLYFVYEGFSKLNDPEKPYILSFAIAAVCIFMFFFRRKFARKFEEREKENGPKN